MMRAASSLICSSSASMAASPAHAARSPGPLSRASSASMPISRSLVFDQAAHAHDVGLDRFEVPVEGGDDMFRRSHVFLVLNARISRSGR
jgi:hypothetical protein